MDKQTAGMSRQLWADYAKGICILLVFIGHLKILPRPARIFIYLFHMPVFFFCMGFYSKKSGSFKGYVVKRFKQLMLPYYVYSIVYFVLIKSIFLPFMNGSLDPGIILQNISDIVFQIRGPEILNHTWFLTAAFVCNVIFFFFRKYLHREALELTAVVLISACLVYLHKYTGLVLPLYIDVAFPCMIFMYLGNITKELQNRQPAVSSSKAGKSQNRQTEVSEACSGRLPRLKISPALSIFFFLIGIMITAAISALYADSKEKYVLDYHMLRLTPFLLIMAGSSIMCLAIYGILQLRKLPLAVSSVCSGKLRKMPLAVSSVCSGKLRKMPLAVSSVCLGKLRKMPLEISSVCSGKLSEENGHRQFLPCAKAGGIRQKSFLAYIGEFSLLYYLFDWIPPELVKKILSLAGITSPVLSAVLRLASIVIFTPLIVELIRRYFWFLFGLKKKEN